MKKLIAITSIAGGLLLVLVPRYILPTCEFKGFSPMHCSETASAEMVVGALLIALGGATFFLKSGKLLIAAASLSLLLYGVSYWLPDKIGYCHSPQMPCNYGTIPAVRFIVSTGALLMLIAILVTALAERKKGKA